MELQTILLLLLLCSQVCHQVYNESSTTWNLSTIKFSSCHAYKNGHFVKSTCLYYSNSSATFNYRLLLSGDIQTNPGPTCTAYVENACTTEVLTESNLNDHNNVNLTPMNITYSRHQLLTLQNNYKLSSIVWTTINNLGIRKRSRGRKAGKQQQCQVSFCNKQVTEKGHYGLSCSSMPIQTRITERQPPNLYPRGVSHVNLITVPITPTYLPPTDRTIKSPKACIGIWNADSISPKTASMTDFIIEHKLDILAVTESWLNGDGRDDPVLA